MIYTDLEAIPRQFFGVIYIDPPWRFMTRSKKGMGRSADNHYKTMSLDEIKNLPIGKFAAPNCALLMWHTRPTEKLAHEVIEAWGFTWKSNAFTWVKTKKHAQEPYHLSDFPMSQGYGTRANPERCMYAVKGQPKRISKGIPELVIAPRREHSRKPDEMYDLIQRLYPGPYLEMFGRRTPYGQQWSVWGDEVDKFSYV